uniref:peptidylprolyl isomerase n=1 Tax=Trypanosoma congolense (strain IL3000) TaxID=1068625 RepID=G0UYT7_TRYCI|nr:unnamed protein product [Trypanosoma congolense IL3000]
MSFSVGRHWLLICLVGLLGSVLSAAASGVDPNKLKPEERINRYRKRVAREFIEKMAQEKGAIRLPSGVVIHVIKHGTGERSASVDDSCTVHYTGTLRDGTVFDSSRERDEPLVVTPTSVVNGWKEVLQLMRAGDHWKVFIPPEQGYGEYGGGLKIPPNAALAFDMELISIEGGGKGRTKQEVEEVLKSASEKKGDL